MGKDVALDTGSRTNLKVEAPDSVLWGGDHEQQEPPLKDIGEALVSWPTTYNPRICLAVDTQRDLITSKVKFCISRPPASAFSPACR